MPGIQLVPTKYWLSNQVKTYTPSKGLATKQVLRKCPTPRSTHSVTSPLAVAGQKHSPHRSLTPALGPTPPAPMHLRGETRPQIPTLAM